MKRKIFTTLLLSILLLSCTKNVEKNSVITEPQRIVADYYIGELLMLNAKLVGADLTYKSSAWEHKVVDIVDVGQSMEKIMSLNPDLIITINQDRVEQYRAIAPTVIIPYGTYNPEELIVELSKITSTEDIAQQWIDKFNSEINELDKLIRSKTETYTIIDIWGGNAYLYGEHFGRGGYIIYNKLKLKGTADGEKDYIRKPDSYLTVNIESLEKYSGNRLLVMSTEDPKVSGSFIMDNVIWKNLEAVKNNHIFYLKSEDFWFTDPFSLDLQIELLKEVLSDSI
ncbi:MAG: ABC transporter substrate-binding protein [Spirochaetales bacterium]|nr:ABC transporter substrate-binding protein [Spirochaetales bacterium]